jgi:hypothetical protein
MDCYLREEGEELKVRPMRQMDCYQDVVGEGVKLHRSHLLELMEPQEASAQMAQPTGLK